MRVKYVIITATDWKLTGNDEVDVPRFKELDRSVLAVLNSGREAILVIGEAGDEILRNCKYVEKCELVFDPNYKGTLFSSVKAGLHAIEGGSSFVWPASKGFPPAEIWEQVENAYNRVPGDAQFDVLRPIASGEPLFPRIISIIGSKRLRTLPADTDWEADNMVKRFDLPLDKVA